MSSSEILRSSGRSASARPRQSRRRWRGRCAPCCRRRSSASRRSCCRPCRRASPARWWRRPPETTARARAAARSAHRAPCRAARRAMLRCGVDLEQAVEVLRVVDDQRRADGLAALRAAGAARQDRHARLGGDGECGARGLLGARHAPRRWARSGRSRRRWSSGRARRHRTGPRRRLPGAGAQPVARPCGTTGTGNDGAFTPPRLRLRRAQGREHAGELVRQVVREQRLDARRRRARRARRGSRRARAPRRPSAPATGSPCSARGARCRSAGGRCW